MSQDFEKQVQRSFDKLKPMAGKNGEDAQKAWTDGFTKNLDTSLDDGFSKARDRQRDQWAAVGPDHAGAYADTFGPKMGNDLIDHQNATTDEMGKNWTDAGQRHSDMYGEQISTGIDRATQRSVNNSTNLWRNSNLMRFSLEDLQQLAKDMPDILGGGADRAGPRVRQSLRNSFQNVGQDIRQTFANVGQGLSAMMTETFGGGGSSKAFKALTDGSDAASKSFTVLFSMGQLVGSALTVLVAGIANVASASSRSSPQPVRPVLRSL